MIVDRESPPTESVYIVRDGVSADAMTSSLQALLPTRHHPVGRHRFTVLDTFDGRVRRAGARLTRTGVDGTARLAWEPRGGRNPLVLQLTRPIGFAWDLPDGPLQQVLAPVVGVRRLLAQADAEGHGSHLDILDDRDKTVARLRIESGQVRSPASGSAWRPLPTIVTLTGLRGYEDVYRRLMPVIESRPGIASCPEGFHGVILRTVGAPDAGDLSSPRVDVPPSAGAAAGARHIHLALLGVLAANEPGLRENLDTEFLHDFRVAVRRTRALLGQIRHVFPPQVVEHVSSEFSWIGRLTGPARDLDVLVLGLRTHPRQADIPADDLDALLAFLGQRQQQAHEELVAALDSLRYRRLLQEWRAFLERPVRAGPGPRNEGRLLAEVVSRRAWRLSRRIVSRAETIDAHTAAAHVHEVRIDAKKLRYLIDVTPAFYDAVDLECILGALKKLQRVLGDFNDAQVQEARLLEYGRAMGEAGGPPGALLALGRLAEERRQRRDRLRGPVADHLARFRAHAVRSACRRAFKRSRTTERMG
jgi:CHAD domain-containing protein